MGIGLDGVSGIVGPRSVGFLAHDLHELSVNKMHIQQAKTSKYCGQACLAMIAHTSLDEAVRAVGHRGATTKATVLKAARKLGLIPKTKVWMLPAEVSEFPANCIVRTRAKYRKRGHWCCFVDGVYHDPAQPNGGEHGKNTEMTCLMEFTNGRF